MDWPKGFKTSRFAPRPLVLLVVLVCAGLAASVGAFLALRASERNRQQTALEQGAAEQFGALQKVVDEDLLALELLERFCAGSEKVKRDEFHEFTKPIHLSCLQVLELAPRVQDADRAAYEESIRQEGFAGFEIRENDPAKGLVPAARRDEYFPVDFIEPAEGNEPARGFDLASSSVRREAMEQARDTGEMRGTARVRLVQETGDQAGFLVFLPVYRNGTPTESVEDRRANLEGFVLGVFQIGDLVEHALAPLAPEGIDVALYDMSAPAGKRLLAWHPSPRRGESAEAPDEANVRLPETLHYAAALRPAGRTWLVLCTPSPEFLAGAGRWYPWEALGVGLAFTALLAAYLGMTTRRTAQIERLAGQLLESNKQLETEAQERERAGEERGRLAAILEATPDFVGFADAKDGHILYINKAGRLMTGLAPDEDVGRLKISDVHPEWANRMLVETVLPTAIRDGVWTGECAFLHRDGHEIPVLMALIAHKTSSGEVDVFSTISRDITERKRAEEAMRKSHEFLQTVIDANPDPTMVVDLNHRVLLANLASRRLAPGKDPVGDAMCCHQISHRRDTPCDPTTDPCPLKEVVARKTPVTFEHTHYDADGQERFVEVSAAPVFDEAGAVIQVVESSRDITARKRAEAERQKTLHRQQGISLLAQSLLATGALKDKLKTVTDAIVRLFDADFCRVWLIRPGDFCERGCVHAEVHDGPHVCLHRDRCLHLLASSGRYTHTDGKGHRRVPFGCYKIGRVASGQEHKFLTNDAVNDPRVHNHQWARELGLVAFAGYQLRAPGGETLGVLALFAKHPISPEEDAMLDGLSSAVALVAQQAAAETALQQANVRLEELATTDALTGLANRRRFMEALEAEFRRSRRYGGRLALAMVDVDRFKSFNDAHGHAFGDRVLVEVAKRLATESRQTDVVARLGGDEFVILMPETSADEAVRAAERIRQILSLHPVSDGERSALATVSVGIATVENGKAGTPESLLKQADNAMYAAKEAGRNRVCLAPSEKAVSPAP